MAGVGTTGANPEMLVLARESRGLTQSGLAKLMTQLDQLGKAISQGYVSKAESGQVSVTSDRLRLFGKALGYPDELLTLDAATFGFGTSCIHFRKRQSASVNKIKQVGAHLNLTRVQLSRLPIVHTSDAPGFTRYAPDDLTTPMDIAKLVRKEWELPPGPIQDLTATIESAGGLVLKRSFPTGIDAVSQTHPAGFPFFIINRESPIDRARFSLAHELGHVLMHEAPTPDQEAQADSFAAEFLMPALEITDDLRKKITLEDLGTLKYKWRVSMAALAKRAHDLSTISSWSYRSLNVELSRLGYRTSEPGGLDPDRPGKVDRYIMEKLSSADEARRLADELLLLPDEVHRLFETK